MEYKWNLRIRGICLFSFFVRLLHIMFNEEDFFFGENLKGQAEWLICRREVVTKKYYTVHTQQELELI